MSRGIFVTGTGTDIGKTYVTALIVKALREAGESVGYYKAAMSGSRMPEDAMYVKEISGIDEELTDMCPYVFEHAYSPHLASRLEGPYVDMNVVKAGFINVCGKFDYVTMEGSGGIMCPIKYEDEHIMLEDVIRELKLKTILIADAGLGTINAVGLTSYYMKDKGLEIKGVIYNNYEDNELCNDNIHMCEELTGLRTLAKVKRGDSNLDIDIDVLKEVYEEL